MGACIYYAAVDAGVPSRDVKRAARHRQGFGRRVPLVLGPMLAPERDREPLRRATASMEYAYYVARNRDPRVESEIAERWPWCEPIPPVLLMWGGPPGTVDERGVARLTAVDAAEVAEELSGHDEAWLRAAYAREHAFIGTILDEVQVLPCHALLRDFFVASVATASEVLIWWELG